MLCKNKENFNKILDVKNNLKNRQEFINLSSYYLKNLISILNSYPVIYSILSHQVIGILKK